MHEIDKKTADALIENGCAHLVTIRYYLTPKAAPKAKLAQARAAQTKRRRGRGPNRRPPVLQSELIAINHHAKSRVYHKGRNHEAFEIARQWNWQGLRSDFEGELVRKLNITKAEATAVTSRLLRKDLLRPVRAKG